MLRGSGRTRQLVTLFHSPSSAISKNLVSLIKTKYNNPALRDFDIEVVENKPTNEQVKTLSSFYNDDTKLDSTIRPILVDWFNGKIAVNDEQRSVKILQDLFDKKEGKE